VFNQIQAGQVIVRKGDEVDQESMRLLREMTGSESRLILLRSPLGSALVLGLAVAFLWVAFRRRRLVAVEGRDFGSVVLILILGLAATRVGFLVADALAASFPIEALSSARSYVFAIPFAAVALLVSVLYGRGAGLLAGVVFSVLVGRLGWVEAANSELGLAGGWWRPRSASPCRCARQCCSGPRTSSCWNSLTRTCRCCNAWRSRRPGRSSIP